MYKVFKEEYGYDPLLEIFPLPVLIQLLYFLGGVHHCVTLIVKRVHDRNFPFALPLNSDKMKYYFINDNETKVMNGYQEVFKSIGILPIEKNTSLI